MKNVRIESQGRFCAIGNRKIEYYNVIADSARFGNNEIMCQGSFADCLRYLSENNIDYFEECWKRNGGRDIQVSFRMYKVLVETENGFLLKSRDGFEKLLRFSDMTPIAPNTFKIAHDLFGRNAATVKMGEARTW